MLTAKLYSVRPAAWSLLTGLAVLAVISAIARSTHAIPSKLFLYALQPLLALGLYGLARYLKYGLKDRVRHRDEKALLVATVLSVWFVVYFLSGLIATYVHNSLVVGIKSILINLWAFGVVAFALEYSRHGLMLLVSRRNMVWFGSIVAIVLAVQQMNFGLIPQTHGLQDYIKLGISDFIPAIISSFLLTYLACAGGLPAMLTYRLGLVAILTLPPIIPKYDWYMQGISLVLLAVSVYLAIDRTQQDKQTVTHRRHRQRPRLAYDIISVAAIIFLAAFMTGLFAYRPAAIASNSMKPIFSRGSIVIIQKIHDPVDVHVGDVVQYTRTDITITHRVVAIEAAADGSGKRVFITKGDNNPSEDLPVAESQLIGLVRSQIPFVGYPTVLLQEISEGRRPQP
jgi:signal peptidase